MQTSPFDTGYAHHLQHHQGSGVYGHMPGFESTGLKFHHGGYGDPTVDACYQNYVNSGVAVTQGYAPREPPTYAESTTPATPSSLFHPGFVPSSSPGYYKVPGGGAGGGGVVGDVGAGNLRQMDMVSEYGGVVRNPGTGVTDNFLMKQEVVGNGALGSSLLDYGSARYSEEDLHHHHQQQQLHHLQHAQHQQHQKQSQSSCASSVPMNMGTELAQEDCKLEPDTQADYKTSTELGVTVGHRQPEDNQDMHKEHLEDAQSPTNDDTSGEGADKSLDDGSTSVTTNADGSQPEQTEGGGDDPNKNSSEVKPTLSYIALIAKSILESPQRRLNLGSIYGWIEKNFPYYKNRGQGWRNSVRHNLSLNDCFIKAGRCEDGKGNYWAIHPANMQDFLRGDFRQRRRSRRRGRKKDCELGMYHPHQFTNGYLGAAAASGAAAAAAAAAGSPLAPQMTFPPSAAALSSIYSPYTEAERRAYRLDEALLRQSMNNPFFKWYHQPSAYPPASSPPSGCNAGVYSGVGGVGGVSSVGGSSSQWPQGYTDNSSQAVYPLNSSFSRNYTTPAIV